MLMMSELIDLTIDSDDDSGIDNRLPYEVVSAVSLPKGVVNVPKGAVNVPKEAVNVPKEAVNVPKGAVNVPKEAVNVPKGAQPALMQLKPLFFSLAPSSSPQPNNGVSESAGARVLKRRKSEIPFNSLCSENLNLASQQPAPVRSTFPKSRKRLTLPNQRTPNPYFVSNQSPQDQSAMYYLFPSKNQVIIRNQGILTAHIYPAGHVMPNGAPSSCTMNALADSGSLQHTNSGAGDVDGEIELIGTVSEPRYGALANVACDEAAAAVDKETAACAGMKKQLAAESSGRECKAAEGTKSRTTQTALSACSKRLSTLPTPMADVSRTRGDEPRAPKAGSWLRGASGQKRSARPKPTADVDSRRLRTLASLVAMVDDVAHAKRPPSASPPPPATTAAAPAPARVAKQRRVGAVTRTVMPPATQPPRPAQVVQIEHNGIVEQAYFLEPQSPPR